jgi:hypothetical protein
MLRNLTRIASSARGASSLFSFSCFMLVWSNLIFSDTAFPKPRAFSSAANYGSPDHGFEKDRISKSAGEENTRDFTYFMLGGARFIYASTARLALIKV